jgi:4-carboxymuconolactone decarboxylase
MRETGVPRIPLIHDREQLTADACAAYDAISGSRGNVAGPFALLLHEPELATRIAHLGTHIRFESTLCAREREMVILTVASELECDYEWHFHADVARRAGVAEDAIAAIRDGREPAEEGGDIVHYVRALIRSHHVGAGEFDALLARLGSRNLITLTATVGYYVMLAYLLNAFEITADPHQ